MALILASVMFLLEATQIPFTVNGIAPVRGFTTPEARLYRPARAPAVYREMARQPPDSVLVELPIGQPDYDLRAMYYSTVHWRPVVNGYSGFFPPHYGLLVGALSEMGRHPEVSLQALARQRCDARDRPRRRVPRRRRRGNLRAAAECRGRRDIPRRVGRPVPPQSLTRELVRPLPFYDSRTDGGHRVCKP